MTRRANVPHGSDGDDYVVRYIKRLEDRIATLERQQPSVQPDPPLPPLPYSWSGPVTDLVDIASSPGLFPEPGVIYRIDYRFAVAASVTVQWTLDGTTIATHSPSSNTHEILSQTYDGGNLVATVTADSGAEGLSAFVFLR